MISLRHFRNPRRAIVVAAVVLLAAPGAPRAADSLFPGARIHAGSRPHQIRSADVNQDGAVDLVIVNEGNDVSVLLGRGDGTFQDEQRSELGYGGWALAVDDLDGDGRPDVTVHGYYQDYAAVALGGGDGRFGAEARYPTGLRGLGIVAGDFDGDGRRDLVSPNLYDRSVSVLRGNGDGTFATEQRQAVGVRPIAVAAGDLNGDGLDDVVAVNYEEDACSYPSNVSVLLASGGGSFAPAASYGVGRCPFALTLADWNGDDVADLAVANGPPEDVSILLGHGDGTFAPEQRIGQGVSTGYGFAGLAAADLDGDGDQDLVLAEDSVRLFLGHGDGTFQEMPPLLPRGTALSVAIDDLDADGHLDLAVLAYTGGLVNLLFGDGAGAFAPRPPAEPRLPVGGAPVAIVTADLNSDGFLDLVTANRGSDDLSILDGTGTGGFLPERRIAAMDAPGALALTEFDGDDHPDLAVLSAGEVRFLRGLGDGRFVTTGQFTGTDFADLAAADVNGDGRTDLALARDGELIVLGGRGDGTFAQVQSLPAPPRSLAVAAGDLNRDGRSDVVVVGGPGALGSGEMFVYLGQAGAGLQPAREFSTAPSVASLWDVEVADRSGDGIPDVVAADIHSGTVTVYPGDGQGNLNTAAPLSFGAGDYDAFLGLGELNGDGFGDAVTANRSSDDVSVLLGHPRGLAPPLRFTAGDTPSGVAQGDFNGDGRPDLAVANEGSGDVSILLNTGVVPNLPPDAVAAWSAERQCAAGIARVDLDASGSYDPNSTPGTQSDITTFEWWRVGAYPEPDVLLGTTPVLPTELPLEDQQVRLKVVDSHGLRDYADLQLDLADRTAPMLSLSLSPTVLWPPNHRLVEVEAMVSASDDCDGLQLVLEPVTSDEPDDLPGGADGATTGDVQAATGTDGTTLQLRAERDGAGNGRTYTVTYRATDPAGNTTTASATVSVPHDQDGSVDPLEVSVETAPAGTRVRWTAVPAAAYYNVVRGELKALRETGSAIRLGPVTCVEAGSTGTDTAGFEDAEAPSVGRGWFYLVEYVDGLRSSYGTESVALPRVPQGGDCE